MLPAKRKLVLLGAGGHAKVLLSLIQDLNLDIAGICDPQLNSENKKTWYNIPVLGGDEALERLNPETYGLVNGIGPMIDRRLRQTIYEQFTTRFNFPTLIHRSAWVSPDAILADGVQVMAGVIIQPGCSIGRNTTINTRASIDHDSKIGPHSHIAPGAVICGGVVTEENVYVGAGATVIQNISLMRGSVIGAGTICVRDIASNEMIIGPNIRRLKRRT